MLLPMLRDRLLFGRKAFVFTLQWHVTQACELSCRHCYDRNSKGHASVALLERTLRELLHFRERADVRIHVCLTGGNPFLHPRFLELYQTIARMGFGISILGNPVDDERLGKIVEHRIPSYFQVSLEGLAPYNDHMRGPGHFERVMAFLPLLRERKIQSQVMMTVHAENLAQVIPLALSLQGKVDRFSFNRLSQVGEGANLAMPARDAYASLLRDYTQAATGNPHMGFKDGLFNILRQRSHRPLTRGCTGFGCGAAFNFLALLPNGEVHACRKFPSPIGNLSTHTLWDLYQSSAAKRYRAGTLACRHCRLRNACGGCLAVSNGQGLSIFRDRDPHCFKD